MKKTGDAIKKIFAYLPAFALIIFLAAFVEVFAKIGLIKGFILPAPSAVLYALVNNFGEMLPHIWETFWVCAAGLVLSIMTAVAVSVLMDSAVWFKKTVYPLLIASQTIPIMVITPVIILLLGFGLMPRLLVVILVCFFPVSISLYDGLQTVDPDIILLMKSMGATKTDIFRHVKFPASMPAFFSGIRISATYCIMATVIAEWQGSNVGLLGIYMIRVKRSYDYDKMFAAILLIVILSLIFFIFAQLAEKKAIRWKT